MITRNILINRINNQKQPQKQQFPTLQNIALEIVAKHYELYPQLNGLKNKKTIDKIIEKAIDYTIENGSNIHSVLITAKNIHQQKYWQKACQLRWVQQKKTINIQNFGNSWKIVYLQLHLTQMIQSIQNYQNFQAQSQLLQTIKAVYPWIFNLTINNVPINMQTKVLLQNLPLLSNLKLKYFQNNNKQFKKISLGMKLADAATLSQGIKNSFNLTNLNLSGNLIDDDLFKFLISGINMNISLIQIDFSHNLICDQGARRIAKFLMRNELLIELNLSNNFIAYDGSRYLAQALKINSTLKKLYLKINSFDDKAGSKFFKDLMLNNSLQQLDLSANSLGYLTARKIGEYILSDLSLKRIMIGNNNFLQQNLQVIKLSLQKMQRREYFEKSNYTQILLK